ALECIPRWLLWRRHHVVAAFRVGLAFRAAGAAWLVYAAVRAGRTRALLPWLAAGLLGYYVCFHSYVQSWYFLPLGPLWPWAGARTRAALAALCVAAPCHYAIMLPFNCRASSSELWLVRAVGVALIVLPPGVAIYRTRRSPGSTNR